MNRPLVGGGLRRTLGAVPAVLLAVLVPAAGALGLPPTQTGGPSSASSPRADTRGSDRTSGADPTSAAAAAIPAGRPGHVTVSLTFDDAFGDQMNARPTLLAHRMQATFYVNSGHLDGPGRLTTADVRLLAGDGDEIGGHTVDHVNLPTLSRDEQLREICDDRLALTRDGFHVVDFAYPYGASDALTAQLVARCGYSSARSTGGLGTASSTCSGCVLADPLPLPAADRYRIQAATSVVEYTRMAQLEETITDARAVGGWVPLVFHDVCDLCSPMAVAPSDLDALLTWLAHQPNLTVTTVDQVGHAVWHPVLAGPVDRRPPGQLVNPTLDAASVGDGTQEYGPGITDSAANPTFCWAEAGYGVNHPVWTRAHDGPDGHWAETVSLDTWSSGDAKLIVDQDSGECSPAVTPGARYTVGGWYHSSAPTRILVFYRTVGGRWTYWTSSPTHPAADGWTRAGWTTPPIPADAARLSFGLQLARVGTLTVGDFSMGVPGPPARRPASGSTAGLVALVLGIVVVCMLVPQLIRRRTRRNRRNRRSPGGPDPFSDAVPAGTAPDAARPTPLVWS